MAARQGNDSFVDYVIALLQQHRGVNILVQVAPVDAATNLGPDGPFVVATCYGREVAWTPRSVVRPGRTREVRGRSFDLP